MLDGWAAENARAEERLHRERYPQRDALRTTENLRHNLCEYGSLRCNRDREALGMQLNPPPLCARAAKEKAKPNNHLLPGEQRYRVHGELVKDQMRMVLLPEEVGEKGFLESHSPTIRIDSSGKDMRRTGFEGTDWRRKA
ncbi:hypothetical protein TNCV_393661 [Trichonephila clavipes]|nr:hypothetical protein TNCV_393661 [Trichonephila clavipes]